jgi:hypothetical protein
VNHGIVESILDIVCYFFINSILLKYVFSFLVVATWAFLGFVCLYMLRVNLSVAIVAMTTPQSLTNESIEACPSNINGSSDTPPKVFIKRLSST